MEINKKDRVVIFQLFSFWVVFFLLIGWVECSFGNSLYAHKKIKGLWKFNGAETMKMRIIEGVPWHIHDRMKMSGIVGILELNDKTYKLYDEKTCEANDEGELQVRRLSSNEFVLRFLPDDNRFNANKFDFNELIKFTKFPGERIPFLFGMKFINDNTVESFSYVRGFGKDKMVKKDDNAFWKRINELPKQKNEDSSEDAE